MAPAPQPGRTPRRSGTGISLQTVAIAAAASLAAAFVIARIWGPGTLFGAAAAPVIVALVSEALSRPIRALAATADHPQSASATGTPSAPPAAEPPPAAPAAEPPSSAQDGSTAANSAGRWPTGRWRVALVTALVAFGIAVGAIAVPDLLAGTSITGNGRPTTFFSGGSRTRTGGQTTTTAPVTTAQSVTTTAPTATTTQPTVTATQTVTVESTPTTTPTAPTDVTSTASSLTAPATTTTPTTTPLSATVTSPTTPTLDTP